MIEIRVKELKASPKDKVELKILVEGAQMCICRKRILLIPQKTTWFYAESVFLDWSLWKVVPPVFTPYPPMPEGVFVVNYEDNKAESERRLYEEIAKHKKFPTPPSDLRNWNIQWDIRKTIQEVHVWIAEHPPELPRRWLLVPKKA